MELWATSIFLRLRLGRPETPTLPVALNQLRFQRISPHASSTFNHGTSHENFVSPSLAANWSTVNSF
jgi:hypothetical protein